MLSSWTTPRLITVLRQAFCKSGAPDMIWSDQDPQFMSWCFQDFTYRAMARRRPQWSWWKSWFKPHGWGEVWMRLDHCSNIGTPPNVEVGCRQPRNCLDTPSRQCQLIIVHLRLSGSSQWKRPRHRHTSIKWSSFITSMHTLSRRSARALTWWCKPGFQALGCTE